jgi:hypothetical protein
VTKIKTPKTKAAEKRRTPNNSQKQKRRTQKTATSTTCSSFLILPIRCDGGVTLSLAARFRQAIAISPCGTLLTDDNKEVSVTCPPNDLPTFCP